jgi:uncharacterized membrane protein YdbT with pleckstrin-like domain
MVIIFGGPALSIDERMILATTSLVLAGSPLAYLILQNRCKQYVLTSERLYIEEGILVKNMRDIPIQKINDIDLSQDPVQRLFGSGDIIVLTGNNSATRINNIDHPEIFKDKISKIVRRSLKRATQ